MALEKSFRFLRLFSHMVKEKVKKKNTIDVLSELNVIIHIMPENF